MTKDAELEDATNFAARQGVKTKIQKTADTFSQSEKNISEARENVENELIK